MIEVRLPQTTDRAQESLIVLWYKAEGEKVQKHEVLVEVQTEKATFEVEAPADGVLHKILVKRAETASVGDLLALIQTVADMNPPAFSGDAFEKAAAANVPKDTANVSTAAGAAMPEPFVRVSPRLRRLASELGVDLVAVQGIGTGGRITEEDVRAAAATSGVTATPTRRTIARRTIARRMMESLQQSAQLTLTSWADVTDLEARRKRTAPQVSLNAWVLRAVVMALLHHPDLNATWTERGIQRFGHVHLGVAVDTEDGLFVPVIRDADNLSLQELHEAVSQRAEKARAGTLSTADLTGGTFTVSNLGTYGVEFFTPILNPPEAGILGVGQVDGRLVMCDGVVQEIRRLPLSLTFDHRVVDGGPAARFLQTLSRLLTEPEKLA